jgi:uroporphyrinogen III methyltransferase/synthase
MSAIDAPPGAGARPGVVHLVGAGPGDPGLVTLRALELLATADVVLHDELVAPSLLGRVREGAEIRWVGKRGHRPEEKQKKQSEIDEELIELARAGKRVVRLKGGDPFLFGRGSEEAESLVRAGVPFEVVPGVTSPLAAAAYAGISLTHRDLASSVTFLTATTRDGVPFDVGELRGLRGTICIFMGLRSLAGFTRDLVDVAGFDPAVPAAVVSRGTRPDQRVVEGTVADIAAKAEAIGLPTPALTIVGAVAGLRDQLRWFDVAPLFGKRVVVTRAAHQSEGTATLLSRRGAEPILVPTIELAPAPDAAAVARAVRDLPTYDLVAFTSENGVDRFFDALAAAGRDARAFGAAEIAAIGDGTAKALARHGVRADLVPRSFVGEALARSILDRLSERGGVAGKRVLVPRARVAREHMPDALRAAGASVDVVAMYETRPASPSAAASLRARLRSREVDAVMVTSKSTLDAFCELVGPDAPELLRGVILASIGPITSKAARERGLEVAVEAEPSTVPSLVDALERHFRASS